MKQTTICNMVKFTMPQAFLYIYLSILFNWTP